MISPLLLSALVATPITTQTLLAEMTDLNRLTRKPAVAYRTIEASSYDRKSTADGGPEWFANGDYGQYIRSETSEGRTEFVMVDHQGPGAALRFWSANPMGTVRFYFDGETKPRLQARMGDLLQGKVSPWGDAFAYNSAMGCNLYFPFAFAKSLKVTVAADKPEDRMQSIYYQFSIRAFPEGTPVQTYSASDVAKPKFGSLIAPRGSIVRRSQTIKPNGVFGVSLASKVPSQICRLTVVNQTQSSVDKLSDPKSMESLMKRIEAVIAFDGRETVRVPLPDLFGAGVLPGDLETLASQVQEASTMTLRFPMPFQRRAQVTLINHNKVPVSLQLETVTTPAKADYVFHAGWHSDTQKSRPMRDMNLVDFAGEGRLVGVSLHVQNPVRDWWGEGDEKVFVDNETFPSWFGTGTEDYFGYAWCCPQKFSRPYHGQARVDGPNNGGQASNVRWHIFDDIPFSKRINFRLEMWHWADTASRYDGTAYWYAKPSKWTAPKLNMSDLAIIDGPAPPVTVKGAQEGERLKIRLKEGGELTPQGLGNISGGEQLWWRYPKDGQAMELEFNVAKAGTYEFITHNCTAIDYGIHELLVNGKSVGTKDFFNSKLEFKLNNWGKITLRKGKSVLRVVCRGTNAQAAPPSRMFGLDYILLK